MNIAALLYFISILSLFYYLSKHKKNLVYFYVFALPFYGLQYDIGLQIELVKLISFIMLLFCFPVLYRIKIYKAVFFFVIYIVLVTILMSFYIPQDVAQKFPALRGKYRWIFQIIIWIMMLAPIFFLKLLNYKFELRILYKIFLVSLTIVSLLGFFQIISFYFLGYDPFPIGILHGEEFHRTGFMEYSGLGIFRISSIGGEPKHLGYSLSIGIIILLTYLINGKHIFNKRKDFILLTMFLVALVLTYSTQGIIITIFGILGAFLFSLKRIKLFQFVTFLFTVFLIGLSIAIIISKFNFPLFDILRYRTTERIIETGIIEDFNEAVLSFVKDHPEFWLTGVGLGNIHLYAQDYIPIYALHYMEGNVFVAKSGILRIFSELGFLGILTFLFMYLYPYFKIKSKSLDIKILKSISILVLLVFFLSFDGPIYFVLFMFLMYGILDRKIDILNKESTIKN